MRHPTEPTDHSLLIACVIGFLICFAGFIAWQADHENDQAIRIQMLSHIWSK